MMKGHPARSMRIVDKRYRCATSGTAGPLGGGRERAVGAVLAVPRTERAAVPVEADQCGVVPEIAPGRLQDRVAQRVDDLPGMQPCSVDQRLGDVERGRVAFL